VVTAPRDLRFRHPSHQPEGEGDVQIYDIKALLEADNPAADSLTELTPEATIPFGVNVARMILSDDGRFLYALQALPDAPNTPAKLVRIDTSTDAASPDHPTFPENQPLHRVVAGPIPVASQALSRGPKPVKSQTPLGGEIFLTPDDNFVLTRFGAVVPLGAQRTAGTERSRSSSTKVITPMPRRLSPR
jgi:hypothetical protein